MTAREVPPRQGVAWSRKEDVALRAAFAEHVSLKEIAVRHQRTDGAIRSRLVKLGLIPCSDDAINQPSTPGSQTPAADTSDQFPPSPPPDAILSDLGVDEVLARAPSLSCGEVEAVGMSAGREVQLLVIASLDQLVRDLTGLRTALAADTTRPAPLIKTVMRSLTRFEDAACRMEVAPSAVISDAAEGDPVPDRLRGALARLVKACVPEPRGRQVALQVLELEGDGCPSRLSDVGAALGVSRERIRQLRNKAFARVRAGTPRRVASRRHLRAIMQMISTDTDWTDPYQTTRHIVRLLSDKPPVVRELALMCCLAAGWNGTVEELASQLREIADTECRKASTEVQWRLDIWKDAIARVCFPGSAIHFGKIPSDLLGRKREPSETHREGMLFYRSGKLGREVACESATEHRVMQWLERTPDVVWYQEQPVIVPYTFDGRDRHYYPDVAALDREGRVYIIEVKPRFGMYRKMTLVKALACLDYVAERGMGFLLVDQCGRTIADYASIPYNPEIADELDTLFGELGQVPFQTVRAAFERHLGRMPSDQFISMVLNRKWSVTEPPGVTVGRLPDGLSFRRLLDHLPRW